MVSRDRGGETSEQNSARSASTVYHLFPFLFVPSVFLQGKGPSCLSHDAGHAVVAAQLAVSVIKTGDSFMILVHLT